MEEQIKQEKSEKESEDVKWLYTVYNVVYRNEDGSSTQKFIFTKKKLEEFVKKFNFKTQLVIDPKLLKEEEYDRLLEQQQTI